MRGTGTFWLALAALIAVRAEAEDAPRSPSGMDRLIGQDARGLIQMLGTPRQDIREGVGRKLQFGSSACILDVYLYPPEAGATPVAAYLAARVPDGRDAERNSCIKALLAGR
jgi:hypothetical protein